jgi:enoyl-CoA hydratase/carnithine racemase
VKHEDVSAPPLTVERRDHIAIVTLNRPERRNAISFALLRALLACARELDRDRELRAVVLRGAGESFSSGIDLADIADPRHRLFAFWELVKPGPSLFQKAFLVWQQMPVPVIAAVHGHCFGAGLQLALAADIRIVAPDAQLSIMESRWGLVPDMGITRTLRGLVAPDVAKELAFTARVLDGSTATSVGLATHVAADPMAAALALAADLSTRSPDALLAAKRVIDAMRLSPARALRVEKTWQLKLLRGTNAGIARRKAKSPELEFHPRQYR